MIVRFFFYNEPKTVFYRWRWGFPEFFRSHVFNEPKTVCWGFTEFFRSHIYKEPETVFHRWRWGFTKFCEWPPSVRFVSNSNRYSVLCVEDVRTIVNMSDAISEKTRKSLTLNNKHDIVKRLQRGAKQSEVCLEMGLSKSTVST